MRLTIGSGVSASRRSGRPSGRRPPSAGPPAPAGAPPGSQKLGAHALPFLALGAMVFAAYATSLGAGFTLDSAAIVLDAERVHHATWANLGEILATDYWWPHNVVGLYRPVATLSYLLDWAVLGHAGRPAGYHWVNVGLHWANAALLLAVAVRALGLAPHTAFPAAALFASHPVGSEAVANIVGRADLLAAAAVLGGLLLYSEAGRLRGRARGLRLAGVSATALLGLLAKENAVSLVGVALLYDLIFRFAPARRPDRAGRAGGAASANGTGLAGLAGIGAEAWRLARSGWVAFAPPLAVVALLRWRVFADTPPTSLDFAQNLLSAAGPWTARLTALGLVARSFGLLVWPARLCPDYSVAEVTLAGWRLDRWADWQALAGLAGIVAAIAIALRLRRRAPAASFSIGFFLVTLLPTSNLLFPIGTTMAERFLYLPLAGFALSVALGAQALGAWLDARPGVRRVSGRAVVSTVLGLAIAAGVARTARRNLDWRDDVALWTSAVESCPASYKSHQGLAAALAHADPEHRRIDEVIAHQETARAILKRNAPPGAPVPGFVLEYLGSFYLDKARLEAARGAGADAAAWAAQASAALAEAAAQIQGENARRREQAVAQGGTPERDVELGTPSLYLDLGAALLLEGRPDDALAALVRARPLATGSAEVYAGLAEAHRRLGRPDQALVDTLEALLVEPRRADLHPALVELYRQADPGGCAVTVEAGQVRVHPECPAARFLACRAYSDLVGALLTAKNTTPEERAAAAEKFRRGAESTFRCSELGYGDLAPGPGAAAAARP